MILTLILTLRTPRDIAHYIVSFAEGEGSFNTSFRPRSNYLLGWEITPPVFNISQKERTIRATAGFRTDGAWAYKVETRAAR